MADWSSLPSELVRTIGEKLEAIEDYSALSAVCRSFRFAAGKDEWRPDKVSQPPWLLLCCQDDDDSCKNNNSPPTNQRFLLSTYKDKKRFSMNLPEIRGRRCFGTPYGWLVTLAHDGQLHLFNPLNRRQIALPAPFHHQFITPYDKNDKKNWIRMRLLDRAILIKMPPNSYGSYGGYDDFLVAIVTCEGYVSLMRPRTSSWEELYCSGKRIECMFDVICYQGRIYAVGVAGILIACSNFDGPDPPTTEVYVEPDHKLIDATAQLYLVESKGELLLIVRHRHYYDDDSYDDPEADPLYDDDDCYDDDSDDIDTDLFEVYKLDQKSKIWIELDDLGDRAFFVGGSQAIVLSSPESANCKSNCIYFAHESYEQIQPHGGGLDMGIFDFNDGTIQPFYDGADSRSYYSVPTWFIPTFMICLFPRI